MGNNIVKNALIGLAVGDALGVPVEFKNRAYLKTHPIKDMTGYGTHYQAAGTWSDDSSLTLCLAESLCFGYDLRDIASKFVKWSYENYWTAHNQVFDVGITTKRSIERLNKLLKTTPQTLLIPETETDASENGNGSLMRILPLSFYLQNKSIRERFQITKEVSALTHAHIRSVIACFIYIEYAILLVQGKEKKAAYQEMQTTVNQFFSQNTIPVHEINPFERILKNNIATYCEDQIESSGYVVHSLEASLWCVLNFDSYAQIVLAAVNLGSDTDTTAAIAGGLAGIIYGFEKIPSLWVDKLARKEDIVQLAEELNHVYFN